MTEHYSNAEWPDGTVSNMYGTQITSDEHRSFDAAFHACKGLEKEGFGGGGEVFPVRTWVSEEENGEAIAPVLVIGGKDGDEITSLADIQNRKERDDVEAPAPLMIQEERAASDRREAGTLMAILDQSMSRELMGNDLFELAYKNPFDLFSPRRRGSDCPISMPIGSVSETLEKPLTKRDRQRLKKKMKKNKSY